jgi:DNA replication licensing factor MCM6
MSSPALPPSATSPTQSRPIIDPLAFNNVRGLAGTQSGIDARSRNGNGYEDEEAEEDNGDETTRRTRRGPTGVNVDDIPRVKDTTGEMVMESFGLFLEK